MGMETSSGAGAATAGRTWSYRLTLLPRPDLTAAGSGLSWPEGIRRAALAGDAASAVLSCLLVQTAHFGAGPAPFYLVMTAVLPALWLVLLGAARLYQAEFLCAGRPERTRVLAVGAVLVVAAATLEFLSGAGLSRVYVVLGAAGAVAGSLAVRALLRRRLRASRRRGRNLQRTLVVGHADLAAVAIEALDAEPEVGFVAVAAALPTDGVRVTPARGVPLAADAEPVLGMVDDLGVAAVVLASDLDVSGMASRGLVQGLRSRGVRLLVATATDAGSWLPQARPVPSPARLALVEVVERAR